MIPDFCFVFFVSSSPSRGKDECTSPVLLVGEEKHPPMCSSRRLSTVAKRIARVGRDARDEVISWRSKARVFVRFARWCASNIGAERILDGVRCVSFAFCVFTRHCKNEKKKSESRASRVARATRERRIERAKSFETYRTHRFHRGLGRFARILPLSRAGLRV